MLKKIVCKLGFHKWKEKQSNLEDGFGPVIYRTYLRCKRCKKWGKLIYYSE
jgi:hypothetical protein